MTPEEAIEEYVRLVWSKDKPSTEEPWAVVRRTLMAALREHPHSDELLLEIGIFHEVVTEEWDLAMTFFDRVIGRGDYDLVFHCSRCLASLGRTAESLALIDGSGHRISAEMDQLRREIADGEWLEYGRTGKG